MTICFEARLIHRRVRAGFIALATLAAASCTETPPAPERANPPPATTAAISAPTTVPAVRTGRYVLVESLPEEGKRDLMRQVVDITVPPTMDADVGGALRHVLARTGYQLCATPTLFALTRLPLPAAHFHLGPMPLADALQTLAGSAWRLTVDATERRVCFTRSTDK
jgi:type IV pili sensor histidine kinase/response regulator